MRRITLLLTLVWLSAALVVLARPQQQESLGDMARQLKEQRERENRKASKVFTNDNLPERPGWESSVSQPLPGEHPSTPDQANVKPGTPPSQETGSNPPDSPDETSKAREYWKSKFKAARQDLAKAKEHHQLAEDELNLLQIQQVRELEPNAKADLTARVESKQSEVDASRAATNAAQKVLDSLEKEFKDSGAPEDWMKPE